MRKGLSPIRHGVGLPSGGAVINWKISIVAPHLRQRYWGLVLLGISTLGRRICDQEEYVIYITHSLGVCFGLPSGEHSGALVRAHR